MSFRSRPGMATFSSQCYEHRSNGFAARCEAVAMPRRLARVTIGLLPWFGLGPSCEALP